MVGHAAAKVIYDPSSSYTRKSHPRAAASEWANFMSPKLIDMYQKPQSTADQLDVDSEKEDMDIMKLLKDIEHLGSSNMSWKERKAIENRKVVSLGGKPPKKHRMPLSVAKVPMKRQKLREEKEREEARILGRFSKHIGGVSDSKKREKRRPEDRVLRTSEGHLTRGVLNVKHLLQPDPPSLKSFFNDSGPPGLGKNGGKGKGGKKKKGKRGKGRGRR